MGEAENTEGYGPTSESLTGPDGRTSSNADAIAKRVRGFLWKSFPATDVRQMGYGPASFDVDLGENLVATVTVDVQRSKTTHSGQGVSGG